MGDQRSHGHSATFWIFHNPVLNITTERRIYLILATQCFSNTFSFYATHESYSECEKQR